MFLISFALSVFAIAYSAVVFSFIWQWFAVAIFGVPPLTVMQALGVQTLLAYVFHGLRAKREKDDDDLIEIAIRSLVITTLFFIFGWCISHYV